MIRAFVVVWLGLALVVQARAQVVEVPTMTLATPTVSQHIQDVDATPTSDGGFMLVWAEYDLGGAGGNGDHAVSRRFGAAGTPLGPPVQIDLGGHVFQPRIGHDGLGGYAVSWLRVIGGDYIFFGQYLSASGLATGNEFEVSLNLAGFPNAPGPVVPTPDGPIFLWDEDGFWARRLDAERNLRGGDIRVGESMYASDVAMLAHGGFVVVGFTGAGGTNARLFGPDGQPRGSLFLTSADFGGARVAADPHGGFVVLGVRREPVSQAYQLAIRRFAEDATPLGGDVLVTTAATPDLILDPDVGVDDHGNAYAVWTEYGGPPAPVRSRAFDVDGAPLGPVVDVGTAPAAQVRTVLLADGRLLNVWDGSLNRVSASLVRICAAGTSVCGDGVRAAACEECDDGAANGNAPGGCRADCRRARCGDGVVDPGESCDDGNLTSCDGCSASCTVESGVVCGDGIRNQACGEECDAGAANGNAPGGCRADCREARCGDGVLDPGEECDDGNDHPCDGCDVDCAVETVMPELCEPPAVAGLTAAQLARFDHGREEFLETENPATGLGPVFNGVRCAECHSTPTVGGSSERNVTRIAADGDPLESLGGPVVQDHGITTATCSVPAEVVPPEATTVAHRNTPALYGLGLIEAIPDVSIRLQRARQKAPLSGQYNVNPTTHRIGRFGWKAQNATIHDFAVEAYHDEIGITSPFAPTESSPQGGPITCDDAPDPEDDGNDVAAFADFMTMLAPLPKPLPTLEARRGRRYFRRLKCGGCHYEKYRTSRTFPVPALRNQKVPLFSDLLIHDMGAGLADGIVQGLAGGSEFRTAPLWGVHASAPYLHDGRAATLEEAILAHGGEAAVAAGKFALLDPAAKAALVAYLNGL